uniref:Tf2-1-like SH3-like domain-containing protein n=1 Tax=Ananas comosus var. bracteatus TaxID=296719 RepID=A0A6V7Q962_ANACO|nr:unnamed protein product [Ananas comosus var. bracteatus]
MSSSDAGIVDVGGKPPKQPSKRSKSKDPQRITRDSASLEDRLVLLEDIIAKMGERGVNRGEMTYLAAIREVSDEGLDEKDLPVEIGAVLADFQDVMPKELPKQLPPRREPYWTYNDVYKLAIKAERQEVRRASSASGLGHIASECPNRRIVTLLDEIPDEEECLETTSPVYDEEVEGEDEVTYGDGGEALVIRRALSATPVKEDDWLRNNIFHTRCTSHGKVCNVIIDGGSCENVVSTTMVEKLQLPMEKHPQPYKLSWLKKGNDLKVEKRCLVDFSIGKNYKDEVSCDVIPMDACHLLLGRPWQFDRKVIHDGFKNTYTFTKDGTKITLGPSKPEHLSKFSTEEDKILCSKSLFLKELSKSSETYALLLVEENKIENTIPPIIVVYGRNPISPLDLSPLSTTHFFSSDADEQAKHIKQLHEQVRARIIKHNEKYQKAANKHRKPAAFKEGDLVWMHLRRERFPQERHGKLKPRADGPFKVLKRIGENAYKIELPGDYNVSATFNIADLSPYYEDDPHAELEDKVLGGQGRCCPFGVCGRARTDQIGGPGA